MQEEGRKGLKIKIYVLINNKTLLRISIEHAKQIKEIKKIFVSTDSKKIADEAKKYGAIVPFIRPKKLAEDNTPEILVWRHAIKYLNSELKINPSFIVSLPTTSPLRKISDIKLSIKKFKMKNLDILFTATKSKRNPYFNIVERKGGSVKTVSIKKKINFKRRQDAPKCFDLSTACYIFKPKFILNNLNLFSGKSDLFEIEEQTSIDIDTKLDYIIAKFLYESKNKK